MIDPKVQERLLGCVNDEEVIDFTRKICEIPSFSGEEASVARFIADRMKEWGFDEVLLPEVEPGRPNVVGILRGSGQGPSLMFNGHIDVDPEPEDYTRPLWVTSIEGDSLFGTGVGNMKAGVAAMIMAAVAVKRAGIPLRGDLIAAGVVGELQGGIGTRALVDSGMVPDYAIVPEPTYLRIRTVHAGVIQMLITTKGRAAWIGSLQEFRTVNAIEKMAKVIEALRNLKFPSLKPHPKLEGFPRMVIGSIVGGMGETYELWRPSYVSDYCTVAIDIRFAPGMAASDVIKDVTKVLDDIQAGDPDFKYELELPPKTYRKPFRAMKLIMPPNDLPVDDRLVQVVKGNHERVLGSPPDMVGMVIPGLHAGADDGHLAAAGAKALNYGPSYHTRCFDEVEISKLLAGTRVLALSAAEICG